MTKPSLDQGTGSLGGRSGATGADPLSFDPKTWTTPPRKAADLDAALAEIGPDAARAKTGRTHVVATGGGLALLLFLAGGVIAYSARPDGTAVSEASAGGEATTAQYSTQVIDRSQIYKALREAGVGEADAAEASRQASEALFSESGTVKLVLELQGSGAERGLVRLEAEGAHGTKTAIRREAEGSFSSE